MSLTNYFRICGKNTPGNRDIVYINLVGNIDEVTVSDSGDNEGYVSAITVISTGDTPVPQTFKQIQADIDGVQFTSEGSGKTNYRETQNLVLRFTRKTLELIQLKEELIGGITCGLVVLRIDGNGKGYLSGWSALEGGSRPYNEIETNFDSGRELTDEEAQLYTITLRRMTGEEEMIIDPDLVEDILDGSATFIDDGS